MKWLRSLRILALTLVLLLGVSCTADDGSLTGVPDAQTEQPAEGLGDLLGGVTDGLGDIVGGVLNVADLLVCSQQSYVSVEQTVGPNGGTIRVGEHALTIPQGALSRYVRIRAEQMRGSTNSVRFSPEGLQFGKSAQLTMAYRNCLIVLLPKSIVYTTERLEILEVLRSLDLFQQKTVTAPIDHFSRYAVAY